MKRSWIIPGIVSVLTLAAADALAIDVGQVDDFQDGTTGTWGSQASPTNIDSGGPDGEGDAYLQVSRASAGPLGARSPKPLTGATSSPWTGDYNAAGVDRIELDANNFGPEAVDLRVFLFSDGGDFTTSDDSRIVLPPGSGWQRVAFVLTEEHMTNVGAPSGNLEAALSNVEFLLIRHDDPPTSGSGVQQNVVATLGLDNITAVPEPATAAVMAVAWGTIVLLRRVRR